MDPQQLVVVHEIEQLKARYFRLLDTKAWDEWGEVFTVDARMEIPESDTVLDGRTEIVARVSSIIGPASTVHHGHTPRDRGARSRRRAGIWAMADPVMRTSAGRRAPGGSQGYGHYHETYRREGGAWRIATTRLERLRKDRC
ncbi:MAG: nuclear transport factor 2 family protein [Acidimicrobiales bacterium]